MNLASRSYWYGIWIPGHSNKEADKAAKEAARSKGTNGMIFTHKTMKSARNQTMKRVAKEEWKIVKMGKILPNT